MITFHEFLFTFDYFDICLGRFIVNSFIFTVNIRTCMNFQAFIVHLLCSFETYLKSKFQKMKIVLCPLLVTLTDLFHGAFFLNLKCIWILYYLQINGTSSYSMASVVFTSKLHVFITEFLCAVSAIHFCIIFGFFPFIMFLTHVVTFASIVAKQTGRIRLDIISSQMRSSEFVYPLPSHLHIRVVGPMKFIKYLACLCFMTANT